MRTQKYKQLMTVAIALIVAGGLSLAAYSAFNTDLKQGAAQDIERQQKHLTTIAASEVERYLYDIQKRIETMASMPEIRDAQRSEACNSKLQKLVETNSKEINNLGRVSKDGTFICAVNRTIIGEPVSKYGDYFQKIADDPHHKPAMSRLIFPSGSASPVVAVHVPVYDSNGNFNGTVGGAVYFDELQQSIMAGTKLSQNSTLALYDTNLDILYHPDPLLRGRSLASPEVKALFTPTSAADMLIEKIKQGTGEGVIDYSLRAAPRHAAYKSIPVLNRHWTVLVAVPSADVPAFVGRGLAQNIFIGISIALVAATGVASLYIARSRAHSPARKK